MGIDDPFTQAERNLKELKEIDRRIEKGENPFPSSQEEMLDKMASSLESIERNLAHIKSSLNELAWVTGGGMFLIVTKLYHLW